MSEGLDQEFKAKKLNAPLTRVEQNQFSGVQGSWEIFSFPELEVQGQNDLYIALCHWIEGFCFIDFFFFLVLHLLFKTLRLSALEMLKGLQASFLALLMHKMLKERLQIWFFFFFFSCWEYLGGSCSSTQKGRRTPAYPVLHLPALLGSHHIVDCSGTMVTSPDTCLSLLEGETLDFLSSQGKTRDQCFFLA